LSDGDDSEEEAAQQHADGYEEEGPNTEEQKHFLNNLSSEDVFEPEIEVKAFLRNADGYCLELFGWLVEGGKQKMMCNLIKEGRTFGPYQKPCYFFWPRADILKYIETQRFKLAPYRKRKPQQEDKKQQKSKTLSNRGIPFSSIIRSTKKAPLIGETCSSKDVPTTDNDGQTERNSLWNTVNRIQKELDEVKEILHKKEKVNSKRKK
jgi:hypothetical protein